jgi:hypothetical protein
MVRRLMVLTVAAVTLALPVCAAAHSTTSETIFHAFSADGTPTIHTESKSGYCWTGSLTADRNDGFTSAFSDAGTRYGRLTTEASPGQRGIGHCT